ncbi:MAG: DUF1552 domain-containing protein [Myxococcales bacterium]|nr:DUF1552 domain-containing protein [Myxococcales bacterium]
MTWTRRSFTTSLAAGLLAAPFCRLIGPARAQTPPTRRLLIFFSPNGTLHRHWRPTGGERDFQLPAGSILEPLAAWRDRLAIVDGLDFFTGDNHEGGQAAMLTNQGGAATPTRGMSLDQYVASRLGAADRFASLELGVLTDLWGAGAQTRISYRGPGELVHPDADPRRAFDRLFADLAGGPEAAARRRAQRRSVLDVARAELADLHGRVGQQERRKLEAHLDALRGVERGLAAGGGCGAPDAPDALAPSENDNAPALLSAQLDLAVLALACGMTRVASVQLSHTVSPVVFRWAGNSDQHHSLSHADDSQVATVAEFVAAERWCAGQLASLLDRLARTPDPASDGSLLDSTVVLWAKELGDPRAHVCQSVPFVLAGGGLPGGRYLRYPGESHARLLVSICQHLGLDNDTFGDPTTGQGPLPGLFA